MNQSPYFREASSPDRRRARGGGSLGDNILQRSIGSRRERLWTTRWSSRRQTPSRRTSVMSLRQILQWAGRTRAGISSWYAARIFHDRGLRPRHTAHPYPDHHARSHRSTLDGTRARDCSRPARRSTRIPAIARRTPQN